MKVYLAGSGWEKHCWANDSFFNFNRLESFAYISNFEKTIINKYDDFLLDSGAFTYLNKNKNTNIDWNDYIKKYSDFINKHKVDKFFELDIDPIIGLKKVEKLRDKLHSLTNKKSIPVWHKSRGLDYFINMCKNFDYIAIGGIVTKEIKKNEYPVFSKLLKIAKSFDTKVHGLGFTSVKELHKYKFYSVDSTSWLSGNRFGQLYKFTGNNFDIIKRKSNQRAKTYIIAKHNFKEWIKFNNYAEKNL